MAVRDLYSKRKAAESGAALVPQTEFLPPKFRTQVVQILLDVIGPWNTYDFHITQQPNIFWSEVNRQVRNEHGVAQLRGHANPCRDCVMCIVESGLDFTLDVIEVSFQLLEDRCPELDAYRRARFTLSRNESEEAISDFNTRCIENGVGSRYAGGQIVETASEFTHNEVVAPAVRLLHNQGFSGAHDEFMSAHKHLRNGDYKPAINDCLNSFESVMKTICDRKGWVYKPTDTAKYLLDILFREGLIPAYLQSHFAGMRSMLEGGVPTVRNKTSGHGQGADPVEVPRPLAEYVLHSTAANILLLVNLA